MANNVHGNYYSPATWEPVSSDNEVDQTEYIQELLDRPSKPLSQAPSEVTRLVPRPKGVAKPSSSSSRPSLASSSSAKASQVNISRSNPLLRAVPKSEVAPATESVTPKSVAPSFKGSASREAGSSSKGSANPRCIDTSFL